MKTNLCRPENILVITSLWCRQKVTLQIWKLFNCRRLTFWVGVYFHSHFNSRQKMLIYLTVLWTESKAIVYSNHIRKRWSCVLFIMNSEGIQLSNLQ